MEQKVHTCPICGKAGLPDFHKEVVVCPCCGSDLSVYQKVYLLAHSSSKPHTHSWWTWSLLAINVIWLGISIGLYCKSSSDTQNAQNTIANLKAELNTLNDSINYLNSSLSYQMNMNQSTTHFEYYIVRKGDSFCRISKHLYGTETRYQEIIKLNQFNKDHILQRGDTLIIPAK